MTTHATSAVREREPAARAGLSPATRIAISIGLLFHLAAVFVPPFSFASRVGPASSPFADGLMYALRPYVDALFLNHGYFFFAPNPGETHLVDYRVEFDDGRKPITGRFPNLNEHRPRLLYHRHFMLAEALHSSYVPPQAPPEPSPPPASAPQDERRRFQQVHEDYTVQLQAWRHRRAQYEALQASIVGHLKATHGGARVTLTRVEHRNLFPGEVADQLKRLDDADIYRNLPESFSATSNR